MKRRQQAWHRRIWPVLAVAVGILFAAALAVRPAAPSISSVTVGEGAR